MLLPCFSRAQSIKRPIKKVEDKGDTTKLKIDSAYLDSALKDPIYSSSEDSIVIDFGDVDTLVLFHNKAKVKSMDMELEADFMKLSRAKKVIFATGVYDTLGVLQGRPLFRNDGLEYTEDSIKLNYESKKALIQNVYTEQGDGYLFGGIAKREPDGVTYIKGVSHTTCDMVKSHQHPHFYILMTKGKIVENPKKYVYFGPTYLIIEDVPMPLILPFGFFPQISGRSSGIRVPTYGEEISRGFFLRNFGYYFAIGDYMDLDVLADYYTLGSWAIRSSSRYIKRYKFNGNFNLEYASNVTGEKGSADYSKSNTFSVRWTHAMSPKARPGTTFNANVNFQSINNQRYLNGGAHNPFDNASNSINSGIAYTRSWAESPFNFSANASHSQNMRDSTYSITFPNFTFTMSRIKPFERKERIGKKAIYEDISFNYQGTFDNKVNFKSYEFGQPGFAKKINNGLNHTINIALPTYNAFNYIQIAPTVRYGTKWYFKKTTKTWDEEKKQVVSDTTGAFQHFGATHEYGFGASASTQIFGIVNFKKGSLVQAVRHVVRPSLSFNYNPDLMTYSNGFRWVQVDTLGNMRQYNIYEGQPFGYPSQRESGSISFNLGNNLEMKVRDRKDTVGFKKVALLNTFDMSTSYNLLADSMNLSNISFRGSTNLPGKTAVAFGFTLDPYAIDEYGRRINRFHWTQKRGLNIGRLTDFNVSFGYSFNGGKGSSTNSNNDLTGISTSNNRIGESKDENQRKEEAPKTINPLFYDDFTMPWNFTFNFMYSYRKSYSYSSGTLLTNIQHTPSLNFSGNVSPTENWDFRLNSGYDFIKMQLTTTQISVSRKLHCFNFSFNWIPLGRFQSWSFNVAISSSMLSDILKYDRQSSFMDADF